MEREREREWNRDVDRQRERKKEQQKKGHKWSEREIELMRQTGRKIEREGAGESP